MLIGSLLLTLLASHYHAFTLHPTRSLTRKQTNLLAQPINNNDPFGVDSAGEPEPKEEENRVANVLGTALQPCSFSPITGFFRDGCCNTCAEDTGEHTVCVRLTAAFLEFSKAVGNDLSTPLPEYGFPGLKEGDNWCLCAGRWNQALKANKAPDVVMAATHKDALKSCDFFMLAKHATPDSPPADADEMQ